MKKIYTILCVANKLMASTSREDLGSNIRYFGSLDNSANFWCCSELPMGYKKLHMGDAEGNTETVWGCQGLALRQTSLPQHQTDIDFVMKYWRIHEVPQTTHWQEEGFYFLESFSFYHVTSRSCAWAKPTLVLEFLYSFKLPKAEQEEGGRQVGKLMTMMALHRTCVRGD
jgi:hypothetical protein